jgi:single-stranded-DNA-specific exonuclease
MELAGIDTTRPVSAMDVGFRLAPRINAAGRMDIGEDVVEMFLERDPAVARALAEKLHRLNDERRAAERDALRGLEAQIEALAASEAGLPACLVLDDTGDRRSWHRGVIGILAARVVDRTGLPALVVTHENGQAYGSGRSVKGFHLLDALSAVHGEDGLLTRFGGHAHAVGFSLPSESVGELRERMVRFAEAQEVSTTDAGSMDFDSELRLAEITVEFLAALEQLGPFGIGNAEPVFVSRGLRLVNAAKVVGGRHLRLLLQERDVHQAYGGPRFGGMAWSRRTDWAAVALAQGWVQGALLDVAYRLRRNWHPEFGGWELDIVGLQGAGTMENGGTRE